MGFFDRMRLKTRLAKRVGAFARAKRQGMSDEDARRYADNLYPPTPEDGAYEEEQRNRNAPRTKAVNLDELRAQFAGTRFSELVEHHLRRQGQGQRAHGVQGTVLLLPEAARGLAESFIDRWNTRAYDKRFWQRDTADVFEEIVEDARRVLGPLGFATDDEAAFNLFNVVIMNYAFNAYEQPKMRQFITNVDA